MAIWPERRRMVDPTEHEMLAMAAASNRAGEFIEKLGKSDMAKWSPQQWNQFIEVVCGGYVESLCEQQAAINVALERARAA
jgi:hypothetical protein